jgi:cysteine desulfurase/selenocysteine lyase
MSRPATSQPFDIDAIRRDFPITRQVAYLDNASVGPSPQHVIDAVTRFLAEYNSGGLRRHWDYFDGIVGAVQARFGELVGADPDELVPIAHASEGINTIAHMLDLKPGDNVITNDLEFPSNFYPWMNLVRHGIEVRVARDRDGILGLSEMLPLVDGRTRVITATSVAFLNGFRFDIEALGQFARERNIYTVVDATQAVGAVRVDVRTSGIDFMACSGMKWLLGPLGTGVLFCRRDLIPRFQPAYVSWLSLKERRTDLQPGLELADTARRFMLSGNIGLAAFSGLAAALDYLLRLGPSAIEARLLGLTDRIIAGIHRLGLTIISPLAPPQRSAIVAFRVADPDHVLACLQEQRIQVAKRMDAIRVSPHFYNTEEEIDRMLAVLAAECV